MQITISYGNRTEEVGIKITPNSAVMIELPYKKQAPDRQIMLASASPDSKDVYCRWKDGTEETYNADRDPSKFILDWRLHDTGFERDVVVQGLRVSEYAYWSAQLKKYRASTTYGLINKIGLKPEEARVWANRGVRSFKYELFKCRGLNLERDMTAEEMANDKAIQQMMDQMAFRDGQ